MTRSRWFMGLGLVFSFVLCGATSAAFAQGKATSESSSWGWAPLGGLHAGGPERLRASLGLALFKMNDNSYGSPGLGLSLEPGLDGGRLSLGLGRISYFGHTVGRITLLRTWDRPWKAPANTNYLGLEAQVPILVPLSALRVGLFRRQGGNEEWLWSWSIGIGF